MDSENKTKPKHLKKIIIIAALILIPVCILFLAVIGRKAVTPTNEEIIQQLYNTDNYSCKANYTFRNTKGEFIEGTTQYYSTDGGIRIEFDDENGRVKVYKGSEITMHESNGQDYVIDSVIDDVYPLATVKNILDNRTSDEPELVTPDWSENQYLKINIDYKSTNKHIDKAEFYVDVKEKKPVVLKIFDDQGQERINVVYSEYQASKEYREELF